MRRLPRSTTGKQLRHSIARSFRFHLLTPIRLQCSTRKDAARRVEGVHSELSNRLEVSGGELAGLSGDVQRWQKKLRADLDEVKRTAQGRFEQLSTEMKMNLS